MQCFNLFLEFVLIISEIESVKLKYVIIAKMNLKVVENDPKKIVKVERRTQEIHPMFEMHPLGFPRIFETNEKKKCFAPMKCLKARIYLLESNI